MTELQSSAKGTNEVQSQQPNPMATDSPAGDSGSLSVASNDNKVSREDIELVSFLATKWHPSTLTVLHFCQLTELLQVQNLIERCLQMYMNKGEVVRTLSTRARIEPGFTTLGDVLTFWCHVYVSVFTSFVPTIGFWWDVLCQCLFCFHMLKPRLGKNMAPLLQVSTF